MLKYPKFNLTGARTHDLHNSTFHVSRTLVLNIRSSGTYCHNILTSGLSDRLMRTSQVQPDWDLNPWLPDHDSTFHVPETPLPSHSATRDLHYFYIIQLIHVCSQHVFSQKIQQICLVQVQLSTEVPRTPSSAQSGLELMTSRSWQYISSHWDACSNH